jgi:mutator protein MutT
MNKILLAGTIIQNKKGEILLLHRNAKDKIQWETPGGKVEEGESPEECAIRETREEIGVEVKLLKKLGQKEFEENGYKMDYIWFLTEITSGEPKISEDKFDDLRFWSLKTLKEKGNLSPNAKNLVDFLLKKI